MCVGHPSRLGGLANFCGKYEYAYELGSNCASLLLKPQQGDKILLFSITDSTSSGTRAAYFDGIFKVFLGLVVVYYSHSSENKCPLYLRLLPSGT